MWGRALLRAGGVQLRIEGLEKIDPKQKYVFVANHSSYMDIPTVLASLPVEIRFYAKQGLFLVPFLGTHLKRAGHLPVVARRCPGIGEKHGAWRALDSRAERVHALVSRGRPLAAGPMREFKEGAAYIAIKAGVPAVPLGIAGTRDVLPMGSNYVRGGPVVLKIGDPIPTTGMKLHDRSQLIARLEREVAELSGQPVEAPRPV